MSDELRDRITNLQDVQARLDAIRADADDDESAHIAEQTLLEDVLRAIADGSLSGEDASACAALALTVEEIEFSRWFA